MITIRHCTILEFGRGASNQAVAPGITRPLHATATDITFEAFYSIYSKRNKPLLKRQVNNETFFTPLRSYYQIYYYSVLYAVYIHFFSYRRE